MQAPIAHPIEKLRYPGTQCRFDRRCTNPDCGYLHSAQIEEQKLLDVAEVNRKTPVYVYEAVTGLSGAQAERGDAYSALAAENERLKRELASTKSVNEMYQNELIVNNQMIKDAQVHEGVEYWRQRCFAAQAEQRQWTDYWKNQCDEWQRKFAVQQEELMALIEQSRKQAAHANNRIAVQKDELYRLRNVENQLRVRDPTPPRETDRALEQTKRLMEQLNKQQLEITKWQAMYLDAKRPNK